MEGVAPPTRPLSQDAGAALKTFIKGVEEGTLAFAVTSCLQEPLVPLAWLLGLEFVGLINDDNIVEAESYNFFGVTVS